MTLALRILHWLCRCVLAVVFVYSGYVKSAIAFQLGSYVKSAATLQFAVAITGYKLVPDQFVYPVAQYFPWIEIALGLWILIGWKIRWSSIAASGLMLFFIAMLSITLSRGIETNCGCFGFGDAITWKTIVRDGSFLVPALYLTYESWCRKGAKKAPALADSNADIPT